MRGVGTYTRILTQNPQIQKSEKDPHESTFSLPLHQQLEISDLLASLCSTLNTLLGVVKKTQDANLELKSQRLPFSPWSTCQLSAVVVCASKCPLRANRSGPKRARQCFASVCHKLPWHPIGLEEGCFLSQNSQHVGKKWPLSR